MPAIIIKEGNRTYYRCCGFLCDLKFTRPEHLKSVCKECDFTICVRCQKKFKPENEECFCFM